MPIFSSIAWVLHDLGLATAIGGGLFGKVAMHPALKVVRDPMERDRAADEAWRRYSVLNLASHGAVLATWLVGRRLLGGTAVSPRARGLMRAKNALIGASLLTGLSSMGLGRVLARRVRRAEGPEVERARGVEGPGERLDRVVDSLGTLNVATNAGVTVLTTLLAMES